MILKDEIAKFESGLNNFDNFLRENALCELSELLDLEEIKIKQPNKNLNLHCHTFFSYNGYGYSPSYLAWWAKKEGLFAAGIVDFDVLDGVDEFLRASSDLNCRGICGVETRVFIPELSEKEINSPGEPGIAYHMGVGFHSGQAPQEACAFLQVMRRKASDRTRGIIERVNSYLNPVTLDFEKDVSRLTPSGNATERHVCEAYYSKAMEIFKDIAKRAEFWAEKLDLPDAEIEKMIEDPVKMQAEIRSKTMKSGGVGYVKPDPESFPLLKDMNEFSMQCGALPTAAWLDGFSDGESDPEKLLDLHMANGAAAINIIPDRNWNFSDQEIKSKKVAELNRIIDAAKKRDLPIIVGTEMNAPGQKHIDDFSSDALAPHMDEFLNGAAIAFAHTMLQKNKMGYLSEWASNNFKSIKEKNSFFSELGKKTLPNSFKKLDNAEENILPEELSKLLLG